MSWVGICRFFMVYLPTIPIENIQDNNKPKVQANVPDYSRQNSIVSIGSKLSCYENKGNGAEYGYHKMSKPNKFYKLLDEIREYEYVHESVVEGHPPACDFRRVIISQTTNHEDLNETSPEQFVQNGMES